MGGLKTLPRVANSTRFRNRGERTIEPEMLDSDAAAAEFLSQPTLTIRWQYDENVGPRFL